MGKEKDLTIPEKQKITKWGIVHFRDTKGALWRSLNVVENITKLWISSKGKALRICFLVMNVN